MLFSYYHMLVSDPTLTLISCCLLQFCFVNRSDKTSSVSEYIMFTQQLFGVISFFKTATIWNCHSLWSTLRNLSSLVIDCASWIQTEILSPLGFPFKLANEDVCSELFQIVWTFLPEFYFVNVKNQHFPPKPIYWTLEGFTLFIIIKVSGLWRQNYDNFQGCFCHF